VKDVFADTAGWAHLLDSSQVHHEKAVSIYRAVQQSQKQLVTTNYVLNVSSG
jgi:predicted nucleic acid-binding protein